MLRMSPVIRLSIAMTLKPSFRKRSARCEPRKPAPPVMSTLFLAIYDLPSYAEIRVSKFFHLVEFIQIPTVKNHFSFQDRTKLVKVRRPELWPFRRDKDRIRSLCSFIRRCAKLNFVTKLTLHVFH